LRRLLVRTLIDERPSDPAAVDVSAREAGWVLPADLAVLVWREGRPRVAPRLPEDALIAPVDDLTCALVPDPDGPGRRRVIETALSGRPAALGPAVAWTDAALSARQAFAAYQLVEEGHIAGRGLIPATEHLPELIIHGAPELTAALRRRALAPLEGETARSRERLADTLLAWLDHHGAASATAAALHVHPQTVRYRLGRLRALFGDRLDDPAARFELALALRAGEA
jgi:hypothetical protein